MKRIYLDHAATSPLLPQAHEAMLPWLSDRFGNPSSLHEEGRRAKAAIDQAREIVADALGCEFYEVVFTSGGTEAAALAILGSAMANRDPSRRRVLLSAAEHPCVLETARGLERLGYLAEPIPVDRIARVRLDALERQIGDDVLVVAAMHANNELGTLQPVREVASLAHAHGALFFCDAVQTFPFPSTSVVEIGADMLSASAHKFGGPTGIGALYVKAGVKLAPLLAGGGQEREIRAGTENVAGIVGFAAAVEALRGVTDNRRAARDRFVHCLEGSGLERSVPLPDDCLEGHAHFRMPGIRAESLLIVLDRIGVSASSGAACSSGSIEPSHVLLACGYSQEEAQEGLRFTFGRETALEEAEEAARRVSRAIAQIRTA